MIKHKQLSRFKSIIAHLLYPLIIVIGLSVASFLILSNYSSLVSMLIPLLICNLIVFLGQIFIPFNLDWNLSKQLLRLDITHTLFTSLVITPLLKILIVSSFTFFDLTSSGLELWPTHWSIVSQVIIAILLADLLIYTTHRWMHRSKIGWRIHVIHHSTTKMHMWAASRTHPFNTILVYSIEVGFLLLLGISSEVLVLWTVFMSVNGILSHSNIDLRLSFFNRVFMTADVHRVHHSTSWESSNKNFGNTTCIWDQIFGTYLLPVSPVKVQGILMHDIPENFIDHMKAPFKLDSYKS